MFQTHTMATAIDRVVFETRDLGLNPMRVAP